MALFASAGKFRQQASLHLALLCLSFSSLAACSERPEINQEAVKKTQGEIRATPETTVTGEVPSELLQSIIDDLAKSKNLDPATISVERSEEVIWPDGALGCGKPGEYYTQASVRGYWVELKSGGRLYDYRLNDKGYFFLCEGSHRLRLPVG